MLKLIPFLTFFLFFRTSESITCYQQLFTGIPQSLTNTNPLLNSNQQQQQQNQYQTQNQNFGQLNLPSITCSPSVTTCFKFVCFGTSPYTVRGCLDYTQTQYTCQGAGAQCLGGQGQCLECSGNNCNGALSLRSGSTRLLFLLLSIPIGAFLLKKQ